MVLAVVARPPASGLRESDGEALGAGRALADAFGGELACALLGSDSAGGNIEAAASEAAERGVERVFVADAPHMAAYDGDAFVAAAAAACEAAEAGTVIVARGDHTLELAPRLAARLGGGVVMGASELRPQDDGSLQAVAPVYGGSALAIYRFGEAGPRVVAVGPKIAEPPERVSGRTAEITTLRLEPPPERVTVVQSPEASGLRLEDARVVVSGGRGLGDGKHYKLIRELAASLDGMAGASRAIVDLGWATPEQQVGLTGKIVTPDLYIAAALSGASQHMMGCSNARVIVAVNTDLDAPIFRYAHYGVVGDALQVLPELIRLAGGPE